MTGHLIFAILVLSGALAAAQQDPLSRCDLLSNIDVGPMIYLSQSELAVIAHYSTVDYDAFSEGRVTNFYITPLCYVKGYFSGIELEIWSGSQLCPVTPLSLYVEYPSLFFLRKDRRTSRWILLNGGEYQHRAGTSGLLFGTGRGGYYFPQVCGLERRRIPMDQIRCDSMSCRGYCNYQLTPPDRCTNKRDLMLRHMRKEDIPKDLPATGVAAPPRRKVNEAAQGGQGSRPEENRRTEESTTTVANRRPDKVPEDSRVYKYQEAGGSNENNRRQKIQEGTSTGSNSPNNVAKGRSAEGAPKIRFNSESTSKPSDSNEGTSDSSSSEGAPSSRSNDGSLKSKSGGSGESGESSDVKVQATGPDNLASVLHQSQGLALLALLFALVLGR